MLQLFLAERMAQDLAGQAPQLVREVGAVLSCAGVQPEIADWLERLGPFGNGNPEPRFVLPDCRIKFSKPVGSDGAHISCRIDDGGGTALNAIAFQAGGAPLGQLLLAAADGRYVHVLGRIRRDGFRGGRTMQIEIEDAATPPQNIFGVGEEQTGKNCLKSGLICPAELTKHSLTMVKSRSSRGLGHRPFTAATRVRISYGMPSNQLTKLVYCPNSPPNLNCLSRVF